MLCDVGSSFTTCSGLVCPAPPKHAAMYMQPFCVDHHRLCGRIECTLAQSFGNKHNHVLQFAIRNLSSLLARRRARNVALAQLGSAAMLISLGFGTTPSNRTVPFRLATPVTPLFGGAPPALATRSDKDAYRQAKANGQAKRRIRQCNFRSCIQNTSIAVFAKLFLGLDRARASVVSAADTPAVNVARLGPWTSGRWAGGSGLPAFPAAEFAKGTFRRGTLRPSPVRASPLHCSGFVSCAALVCRSIRRCSHRGRHMGQCVRWKVCSFSFLLCAG